LGTKNGDIVAGNTCFPLLNQEELIYTWTAHDGVLMVTMPYTNQDFLNNNEYSKYEETILWERKEETILKLDGVEYSESTLRSLIKKVTS